MSAKFVSMCLRLFYCFLLSSFNLLLFAESPSLVYFLPSSLFFPIVILLFERIENAVCPISNIAGSLSLFDFLVTLLYFPSKKACDRTIGNKVVVRVILVFF